MHKHDLRSRPLILSLLLDTTCTAKQQVYGEGEPFPRLVVFGRSVLTLSLRRFGSSGLRNQGPKKGRRYVSDVWVQICVEQPVAKDKQPVNCEPAVTGSMEQALPQHWVSKACFGSRCHCKRLLS
ncbi:hypothetical protein BDV09DRAFT_170561 [Aspergillus tetrazonus]